MDLVSQLGTAQTRSKRWLGAVGIVLGVVLLWGGPWIVLGMKVAGSFGFLDGKSGEPVVAISRETTHIVRPLDEEGYVDYVAALNERSRQGVTPENNAAALLWQALGPAEILEDDGEEVWRKLAQELGISPLPEEGEYFLPLDDYGSELQKVGPPPRPRSSEDQTAGDDAADHDYWWEVLREQFDRASRHPWSAEEFPELAAWLERNEAPLGQMVEASWKERYYSPLIRAEDSPLLVDAILPSAHRCHDLCAALAIRAMLRLHEGNIEEARGLFFALHRWARLIGQGPLARDGGIACEIDGMACSGAAAIARRGNLTSDEIRQYRADLNELAPFPGAAERLDVAQRFMFLDSIIVLARGGENVMDSFNNHRDEFAYVISMKVRNRAVNWDTVLRIGNGLYDRGVEIGQIADRAERTRKALELKEETRRLAEADFGAEALVKSCLMEGFGEAITGRTGRDALEYWVSVVPNVLANDSQAVMMLRLADTSLALAAHRARHCGYPEMLDGLMPEYVDELPRDAFSGGQLGYTLSGDDYLLYSVGPNLEDDEGRTRNSSPCGDDIVIHTAPAP